MTLERKYLARTRALEAVHTFSSGSILAEYLRKHSIGMAVPPVDSKSLAKAIEARGLKNQSELNSNELSFAREYDKAKVAEELSSRILKGN